MKRKKYSMLPSHFCMYGIILLYALLLLPLRLVAQTISSADVTATLGPSFFLDEATNGGSDTDIHQPNAPSYDRTFSSLISANQGPTKVIITGIGFAAHTSATANDATTLSFTLTYLGADQAAGGGDDVSIGTASGAFQFSAGGEYAFAFASPLMADLNITGTRFRIQIAPTNVSNNGSLKLKSSTVGQPFLSVAGTTTPTISPIAVNLAKFQPVSASSAINQRFAAYLTDGVVSNDNRWESGNVEWSNARLDFPFPIEVGSAQVFSGVNDALAIGNYNIQYLNGATWTTIPGGSVTGNTNVENNIVFTSSVTAQSFRIIGQEFPLRIREWALYPPNGPSGYPLGTDLNLNVAHQKGVTATAHTAGHFPWEAVDGRTHIGSFWRTTTSGTNTLEIHLQVNTKVGSVHLYSGTPGVAALANFRLQYWNGSAWVDFAGGSISGNTVADRVISVTPEITNRVRLEFTNPGTTTIREMQVFPANAGNVGYPIGTSIISSGNIGNYDTYHDAFHQIRNPTTNRFIQLSAQNNLQLSQSGLDLTAGQYQILLNLADGTYRLRNRSTGNCLAGHQLTKTPGLPLVDEPYRAMPHQDWILTPMGLGHFQFINAWSGLAIDTQDSATSATTPLIQNIATGSATQRWQLLYSEKYPKKGVGGTNFATPLEANWVYRWGPVSNNPLPYDCSFYPMQWGNFSWDFITNTTSIWQHNVDWRRRGDGVHLMGFNEPDRFDQSGQSLDPTNPQNLAAFSANRTIAESVRLWPRLLAMNQPLVSPVPANDTSNWFPDFYAQSDALGYRVDYTAIHLYPGPNGGSSNGLISSCQNAFNNFDRPVWLTEFSFVDWGKNQSWSEEDNYQALAEFLWRAESLPWLRKYALFVFTENDEWPQPATTWQSVTPAPRSNTYDRNGSLTAFGKLYAGWDNDNTVRSNKTYYVHHKDSNKRLASISTHGAPVGRNIRTDGSSVHWTLVPSTTSNRFFVVSAVNGRRLSTDGTAVTMVSANTTGPAVEWTYTEAQHGWFYLGHPSSSKRLQLSFNNSNGVSTYTMATTSVTSDAVQWRFIVPSQDPVWTGFDGNTWTKNQSWTPDLPSSPADIVTFNQLSISNLATILGKNFDISGINVQNPAGNISIDGTHTLSIGSSGIDLSTATRDLSISATTILSASQQWNVAAGRMLEVNGSLNGAFPLSIQGAGITSIGGAINPLTEITIPTGSLLRTTTSSILPHTPDAVNISLQGTIDLRGTNQTVPLISGNGTIDNTATSPAAIIIGAQNATGTLSTLLQNTSGALTLQKIGSGNLTLPIANTHSGGFINHGTGNVTPQNESAFGTGAIVMNGATLITSAANFNFSNHLTLNGATLRVGGGNSNRLTWNGNIATTGNSTFLADSGTSGITVNGDIAAANATLTFSSSNFSNNIVNGIISGANGNLSSSGTNAILELFGNNTINGTITCGEGTFFRLHGTLGSASSIVVNGVMHIRNTSGWIHNGTISGDQSNVLNLNQGTNATLAGSITGIQAINANDPGTNATITGSISGNTNVTILENVDANGVGATLRIGGDNTYTGITDIKRGRLSLIASNTLPDSSPITLGAAVLDAGAFQDTAGTIDPTTTTATIQLGSGAALAFANSSAVSWTGGRLNVTGTFISGSSLRFGTNSSGLTSTQLGLISISGVAGPYTLNSQGYLLAASAPIAPYDAWKSANATSGEIHEDHDSDGVANGIEYFLAGTTSSSGFTALPTVNSTTMSVTWTKAPTYSGAYGTNYVVETSATLSGTWASAPLGTAIDQVEITGNEVRYRFPTGTKRFARLKVLTP